MKKTRKTKYQKKEIKKRKKTHTEYNSSEITESILGKFIHDNIYKKSILLFEASYIYIV